MDDPRWLRLITIGLILAALAVGYFLFTGKFSSNSAKTTQTTPEASVLGQTIQTQNGTSGASPNPVVSASPNPASAYARIVTRNQQNQQAQVQTLPKTGFPAGLAGVLSISAMFVGYGLRRFPK